MADEIFKECCTDCGCTAEIGTVIHEDDTVYEFELKGSKEDVLATFEKYQEAAKKADSNVAIKYEDAQNDTFTRKGSFEFSCTAQKLIFQLRSGAQ